MMIPRRVHPKDPPTFHVYEPIFTVPFERVSCAMIGMLTNLLNDQDIVDVSFRRASTPLARPIL